MFYSTDEEGIALLEKIFGTEGITKAYKHFRSDRNGYLEHLKTLGLGEEDIDYLFTAGYQYGSEYGKNGKFDFENENNTRSE